MNSRYPQDSNIIDFIEVKMLQLVERYSTVGQQYHADACWSALDAYVSGTVDIIFKHGEPYVIDRENNDITILEEDD
tara:strand:+ start:609 stop:839 length:231 start_codon:yes stop_codon:yes gene_type:complete